jgi:hypothetical protein
LPSPHTTPAGTAGAIQRALPADQQPQLCTPVRDIPTGTAWLSEIKFDSYRFLAWKTPEGVRLVTRNGRDWTDRLPAVAGWLTALDADSVVLDGELVALRPDGHCEHGQHPGADPDQHPLFADLGREHLQDLHRLFLRRWLPVEAIGVQGSRSIELTTGGMGYLTFDLRGQMAGFCR